MNEKQVLIVIAQNGYQPVEFGIPKDLLDQAGYTIVVASNKKGTAHAIDNSTTEADVAIGDTHAADYQGVILIGGGGAMEHLDNEKTYRLVQGASKQHKVVGAICVSTRILAKAGILEGKSATGWDGDNALAQIYKQHLVNYVCQDVVVDGNIVTATDPSTARKFGQTIISALQSQSSWG